MTVLGLLNLSAAFNCVDHDLLQRLQPSFGLNGVVLQWIQSFVTNRAQHIVYSGQIYATQPLLFGIPQSCDLWLLLYVLYTAELRHRVARYGMHLHQYADDSQVTPPPVLILGDFNAHSSL